MEVTAWYSLQTVTGIIIHVGAIIAAVGGIYIAVVRSVRWLRKIHERIKFVLSEQHDHQVISAQLRRIESQFQKNGGTSAMDKLDKIMSWMKENTTRQNTLDARIRATLHIHPTPVFETDSNGLVTYVNQAYTRMAGMSAHELMGEGWVNIVNPATREDDVAGWFRAVNGIRNYDGTPTFVKPDGSEYKVHVIAHVIKDDEGALVGHFGKVLVLDEAA